MSYNRRLINLPCANCGRRNCSYCNIIRPFSSLPQAHDLGVGESFSVVVPQAAINLLTNPTPFLYPNGPGGGLAPTVYFAHGGINTPQILSGYGTHGAFGVWFEPSTVSGAGLTVYNGGVPNTVLTSGQTYSFSFDHRAEVSSTWEIVVSDIAETASFSSTLFTATGDWQRVVHTFTPMTTQEYTFLVRKIAPNPSSDEWTAAAFQLETGRVATTYFDGFGTFDWPGLTNNDYAGEQKYFDWVESIPWKSTSRRGAYTRAGGIEVNLADVGFQVSGYGGLGMPDPNNISQPYATLDGSYFSGAPYGTNIFTITGRFDSCELRELHNMRAALRSLLMDGTRAYRDQMIIRYTPRDSCGVQCGPQADIICRYGGGLSGAIASTMEDITLSFEMYNPFVRAYNQRDYQETYTFGNGLAGENGDVELKYTVCNGGDTYAQPIFLLTGDFDLNGVTITNDDTGHVIMFRTDGAIRHVDFVGPGTEIIIVNTSASASQVVSTLGDNLTGLMEACSNLANFELACGWNRLTVNIPNVTNPSIPGGSLTQYRPYFRVVWREQFAGIDTFAACNVDAQNCDTSDADTDYMILD